MNHSVNAVYIKGLRLNGVDVGEVFVRHGKFFELIKLLINDRKSFDTIFIGYDSPQLVILSKLFSRKKIIYNALCSVYERLIVSRAIASPRSIKAISCWFLDFLSFNLADLIMVETNSQADHCAKFFLTPRKKFFRAWTGVDEEKFYHTPTIEKFNIFTVLFRGSLMPEAGAEYVIQAAKTLEGENIKFVMHVGGILLDKTQKIIDELKPRNLEVTSHLMTYEELSGLMQKCHLSLGQLSHHPRLNRTIPHKAYESLAMRLPYLTASNVGIMELLRPGETCIVCESASSKSLAEKILWAKNNPQELERITENGFQLFQNKLRSHILVENLLKEVVKLS